MMKLWVFCLLALLVVSASTTPLKFEAPTASAEEKGSLRPIVRVAREDLEGESKEKLKGAESAYLAYPYAYPYYTYGHYPYVIVGK